MNIIDRMRIESAIQRYDFWLELRGIKGSRRRDLRRELRTNLTEASADVGTTRALFGIGSPKELAHAATDVDRSRPRWSQAALAAALTLWVVLVWLVITTINVLQTLEATGAESVEVSPFPWWGTTFLITSTPESLSAGIEALWQPFVLPLIVFFLVAQPWRLLRRRQDHSAAVEHPHPEAR